MTERTVLTASVLWLLTCFLCLILPIFIPSSPNPSGFPSDPTSISTGVMYILSFPGGLLSLLFSPIIDLALDIDPNSIAGMYLNLKLMVVLGLVQWFVIVPRMFAGTTRRNAALLDTASGQALPDGRSGFIEDRSRLERVLDENEQP
jgi:hypothetical protein